MRVGDRYEILGGGIWYTWVGKRVIIAGYREEETVYFHFEDRKISHSLCCIYKKELKPCPLTKLEKALK